MNWLDFRSKIIYRHVEAAIAVVSFFFLLHVQGLCFLDYLVISTILKPTMYEFYNNFTQLYLNLL